MKPNAIRNTTTVDRLATADEIHAAVLIFPDPVQECTADILHEIPYDFGGYVRVSAADLETSLMVEELIREYDTLLD